MNAPIVLHENIDAVAIISPNSEVEVVGKASGRYEFASVSKILTTLVIADGVQSGFLAFDDFIESNLLLSNDVTLQDLLSHCSGIRPDGKNPVEKHTKRIYTNEAFELAGRFFIEKLESEFGSTPIGEIFDEGLNQHLGATIQMEGSCATSANGTLEDLIILLHEMRNPTFIERTLFEKLTTPYLPALEGILPGWGNYKNNTFGIGFEVRNEKQPHWTGQFASPKTYGHFGQSGAFVFHDPVNNISIACVTNKDFSTWAKTEYPKLVDDIYRDFDLATG